MPETQSLVEHAAAEPRPAQQAARGGPRPARQAARRRHADELRRAQGADPATRPPHAVHPPRHAAGALRVAVDATRTSGFHRDGETDAAGVRRARTSTLPLDEYVCLVHDPRPTSPFGRTYTVEYLGNVVGAPPVTYLNVEMALMKQLAAAGDRRRRAGVVRLRRRQDDATRPRAAGTRPVRLRRASTTSTSDLDKADRLRLPRDADDARDAASPASTSSTARRAAGGSRTPGATEKADKGFLTMNDTGSTSTSSRSPSAATRCPPSCRPRSTTSRSCCRRGTRWARSPAEPAGRGARRRRR